MVRIRPAIGSSVRPLILVSAAPPSTRPKAARRSQPDRVTRPGGSCQHAMDRYKARLASKIVKLSLLTEALIKMNMGLKAINAAVPIGMERVRGSGKMRRAMR